MAVIRFDPNTPVELALKFDSGKEVQSKKTFTDKDGNEVALPNQMLYTVCGDDMIYLPLHVGEQISKLGVKKMELISICKRVQGKATKWEVKRAGNTATQAISTPAPARHGDDCDCSECESHWSKSEPPTMLENQLTRSIAEAKQTRQASQAPTGPQIAQPFQKSSNTQANSTPTPIAHTIVSRIMASALIAAFDATQECERYAHSKGTDFEFSSEDIRAISNTIFIALTKDPAFVQAQKINGTAQGWQQ